MSRIPRRLPFGIAIAVSLAGLIACNGRDGSHTNPALLGFTAAAFSANEGMRSVSISVSRTVNTAGVVTVDYATSDGTATAGEDYTATSGTLTWADGDGADKTFTIPLIEDGCSESPETVDLSLSNATGRAVVTVPGTAVLTIDDNDVVPSGGLDPGFGAGGIISENPTGGYDCYTTVAVSAPYLYVAGWDESPGTQDWQWRIEKRSLIDGAPDPGFGLGGVVTSNPSPTDDSPIAIVVDSAFIYCCGWSESSTPGDWEWRVEKRSLIDGALDPAFGPGGAVTSNPSPDWDTALNLVVDSSFVYVIGDDESPAPQDWQWRIEKRSIVDGALDPAFGPGGVVTINPSPGDDTPLGMAIDPSYLYVIGYDASPGPPDYQWRIEKRSLIDGSRDPGFGNGGAVLSDPTAGDDSPWTMAVDASYIYAIGYDESAGPSDWGWRIEKRSVLDGSLDPGFGTGGAILENPSLTDDEPWYIVIDASFMYVSGYDEIAGMGDPQWRIEKRSLADGSLDSCFGTAGVVTSDPSLYRDVPWWMAADSSFLYIVGEDMSGPPGDRQMRIEKRLK